MAAMDEHKGAQMNSDNTSVVRTTNNFAAMAEATFDAWLDLDIMRQWLFAMKFI